MIPLRVTVWLYDTVIEDRTVGVRDTVRLGESPEAEVGFPGADLFVVRRGDKLLLRGREVLPGQPLSMYLGGVTLQLEALDSIAHDDELPAWQLPSFDLRVLVATAAVALTATFVDTVSRFVETDPNATEQLAVFLAPELLEGFEEPTVNARFTTPDRLPQVREPASEALPVHDFDLDEEPLEEAPTVHYRSQWDGTDAD